MSNIFLAAPYTQWMDWTTGRVRPDKARLLNELREALLADGHAVFNAHHNESWGEGWLDPEVCTPADHQGVSHADVVCAIIGDPPSPGVMIELGWASAQRRPVMVLIEEGQSVPALVAGIATVTPAVIRTLPAQWTPEALKEIRDELASMAACPPADWKPGGLGEYPQTSRPFGYECRVPETPRALV